MSKSVRNISSSHSPVKGKKYSIIIPAAGEGIRMSTYGPKPLLKFNNGECILDRQLSLIDSAFSSYEVILISGYQAEKVMNYAPQHVVKLENSDYKTTNIVKSIAMGLRAATTDNIIIIHGDLVFNKQCLKAPFDLDSFMITSKAIKEDEIGCTLNNGIVENIFYDLPNNWSQITYLTGNELNLFRKIVWNKDNWNMYHFEALNNVIDKDGIIKAIAPNGAIAIDIDTSKDIMLAESNIL